MIEMIEETRPFQRLGPSIANWVRHYQNWRCEATAPIVPALRWVSVFETQRTRGWGDRVDTERGAYTQSLRLYPRVSPLAVGIPGVPNPMFKLDTGPGRILC